MIDFSFISDTAFRRSIVEDYLELEKCIDNQLWKAAYVLSGSIIEVLLSDYLITYMGYDEEEILKDTLGSLIRKSRDENIISAKVDNLCILVKNYRNQIHPGLRKRTGESPNKDEALIAKSLVGMIAREIAEKKKEDYGYTAYQFIELIENNTMSVKGILPHLVDDLNKAEKENVLDLIPAKLQLISDEESYKKTALKNTYHFIYNNATKTKKDQVLREFVETIKTLPNEALSLMYNLFRASYLKYATRKKDIKIIKDFFISQMWLLPVESYYGIGQFLEKEDLHDFILALRIIMGLNVDRNYSRQNESLLAFILNIAQNKTELIPEMIASFKKFNSKDELQIITNLVNRLGELIG